MKDIRVAAVCMRSEVGDIEGNLERTARFTAKASGRGADIVCFPELSITGYVLKDPLRVYKGRPVRGIAETVCDMAEENGVVIIAGMIELEDGGRPYISQMVAGPDGLKGYYRKTHLSVQEKEIYQPGNSLDVFTAAGVTFGVQLCYETHFPEISTVMALGGADILFMPHASPQGGSIQAKLESWLRHLPGRAFDNGVYLVACNQVGESSEGFRFPGAAVALNPLGRAIARYSGDREGMLVVDLKKNELEKIRRHRMRYFVPYRRPELYGSLISGDRSIRKRRGGDQ